MLALYFKLRSVSFHPFEAGNWGLDGFLMHPSARRVNSALTSNYREAGNRAHNADSPGQRGLSLLCYQPGDYPSPRTSNCRSEAQPERGGQGGSRGVSRGGILKISLKIALNCQKIKIYLGEASNIRLLAKK